MLDIYGVYARRPGRRGGRAKQNGLDTVCAFSAVYSDPASQLRNSRCVGAVPQPEGDLVHRTVEGYPRFGDGKTRHVVQSHHDFAARGIAGVVVGESVVTAAAVNGHGSLDELEGAVLAQGDLIFDPEEIDRGRLGDKGLQLQRVVLSQRVDRQRSVDRAQDPKIAAALIVTERQQEALFDTLETDVIRQAVLRKKVPSVRSGPAQSHRPSGPETIVQDAKAVAARTCEDFHVGVDRAQGIVTRAAVQRYVDQIPDVGVCRTCGHLQGIVPSVASNLQPIPVGIAVQDEDLPGAAGAVGRVPYLHQGLGNLGLCPGLQIGLRDIPDYPFHHDGVPGCLAGVVDYHIAVAPCALLGRGEIKGQGLHFGSGEIVQNDRVRTAARGYSHAFDIVQQEDSVVGKDFDNAALAGNRNLVIQLAYPRTARLQGCARDVDASPHRDVIPFFRARRFAFVLLEHIGSTSHVPDVGVAVRAADEGIVSRLAVEPVATGAAFQPVAAAAAEQVIVVSAAVERIGAVTAQQQVVPVSAPQHRFTGSQIGEHVIAASPCEAHVGRHALVHHDLVLPVAPESRNVRHTAKALAGAGLPFSVLQGKEGHVQRLSSRGDARLVHRRALRRDEEAFIRLAVRAVSSGRRVLSQVGGPG